MTSPILRMALAIPLFSLFLCALPGSTTVALGSECDGASANPQWVFCHDFEQPDSSDFDTYWNDVYGVPDRVFIHPENPPGLGGSNCMRTLAVNETSTALTSGVSSGPKKFLGKEVTWDALYYRKYIRFNLEFKQGNFMHLGGMGACAPALYPWECMGGAGKRPDGDDRFSSNLEPWS